MKNGGFQNRLSDPTLKVIMRILHILSGVVYAGNTFFLALLLEPELRSLGPAVQGPVMGALVPVLIPIMTVSSAVVIGSGAAIPLILRWGTFTGFWSQDRVGPCFLVSS